MAPTKKCPLCDTIFERTYNQNDFGWEKKIYCDKECMIIVGYARQVARSGHAQRAYELTKNEAI